MKLIDFINENQKTQAEVAADLDTTQGAVSRWCNGDIIPRPQMMEKIIIWSEGKVTPNDFYVKERTV